MAAISPVIPIDIFYTICTDYDYAFTIFGGQMARLQESGLADRMRSLTITVAGSKTLNIEDLSFREKIKLYQAQVASKGEFYTLFEILQQAQEPEEFYAFYFHCKGCTHSTDNQAISDWRELMEYFLIDHWQTAIGLLEDNDTVGCNQSSFPQPHYSGNFWWGRSSYLQYLPNPNDHYLAFYTEYTLHHDSERHSRLLAATDFDDEFVMMTYPENCTLPILPNLSSFIRKYGFDWIWYTRHNPPLSNFTAEKAIQHWKIHGIGASCTYPDLVKERRRINAETWIQRNGGKHHSVYNSNCCHYADRFPSENYKQEGRHLVAVLLRKGALADRSFNNNSKVEYRIYANFIFPEQAHAQRQAFNRYWHAVFTHLTTTKQLDSLESYLRSDSQFHHVIVH